ncbi:MAG: hypothetical protein QNK03_14745 [Myxococcota bacterium]|nr:hypothetical protein [Myxococcota bacterium]
MASESVRPWFCRIVDALPGAPVGAAVAIAGGLGAVQLFAIGLHQWFALAPRSLDREISVSLLVFSIGIAYLICAGWLVVDGARRDLVSLRASLRGGPERFESLARSFTHHERGRLLAVTLGGPLVPFAIHAVAPGQGGPTSVWLAGAPLDFELAYRLASQLLFWLVAMPVFYVWGVGVQRLWRCGRHALRVDLLDLEALAPFTRVGLRLALVVLAVPLLLLPVSLVLGPPARIEMLLYLPVMALGIAALAVPAWGLRGAIRAAKQAELERVRRALHGEPGALDGSLLAGQTPSLIELLRYRHEIRALREWPFDAGALGRLGLYLLIPVASWVAGALVERFVDRVLG